MVYQELSPEIKNILKSYKSCTFGNDVQCISETTHNPENKYTDDCIPGCHEYEKVNTMIRVSMS